MNVKRCALLCVAAATCTAVFLAKRNKPRGEQDIDKQAMRKSQQGELDGGASRYRFPCSDIQVKNTAGGG